MEIGIEELKAYIVIGFYSVLFLSIYGYDVYLRRGRDEGVSGTWGYSEIPPGMRWMPMVATLCGLYILAYSFIFIFYPDIQNYYLPVRAMQDSRIAILGMALVIAGLAILLICQYQLGRSYRLNLPNKTTQLVTTGLYAISRNPLYIGLYMAMFGIFFMLPNWIYLVCLLFFILNYHFKITLLEEKYLLQQFGEEYQDYCARVRRYL